jgi:hypothetical protein
MTKHVALELFDGPNEMGIRVEQTGWNKYTVTYGVEIHENLDYYDASTELGRCIFHRLGCDQCIDSRDARDAHLERLGRFSDNVEGLCSTFLKKS